MAEPGQKPVGGCGGTRSASAGTGSRTVAWMSEKTYCDSENNSDGTCRQFEYNSDGDDSDLDENSGQSSSKSYLNVSYSPT